ncbi:MAG: transposase [Dyadobacter sp. 50-39]|uniref:IS200/IS605 family transposase n=1 Tax=Dyadobacter sp. 50-39 TaxID=1895756 RepID=UPI00095AEA52|nr:IS200/IS605 family transposase [Dyadobacter sp. 50-39]OJV21266.1 MAG: transposase [Dyadobacter sp. 50-39]
MSWTRIWIHVVFATKYRVPVLRDEIRKKVFVHIREYAMSKGIELDMINGYVDHAHCLICLNRQQTLADVMKIIKGESAHWINKYNLTAAKFVWQDDYWAVSVSERHVTHVRRYISKQEEHHKAKTFDTEINRFMIKYGWTNSNKS